MARSSLPAASLPSFPPTQPIRLVLDSSIIKALSSQTGNLRPLAKFTIASSSFYLLRSTVSSSNCKIFTPLILLESI